RLDMTWNPLASPIASLDRDEFMPAMQSLRKTDNKRERMGLTGTVDYKFNANSQLVFNYMFNQRNDSDDQNRFRYDFDRPNVRWQTLSELTGARVRRDVNLWDEDKSNHSFNLQGFHTLNSWQLDWGGYYTMSKRKF